MVGKIHLFKMTGTLTSENVKLNRNIVWYVTLDWKEINVTLNGNKINLPKSVTIKLRDKFKIRCIIRRTLTHSCHVRPDLVYFGIQ